MKETQPTKEHHLVQAEGSNRSILSALQWAAQISTSLLSTLKRSVELREWLLVILETLQPAQKLILSPRGREEEDGEELEVEVGMGRWMIQELNKEMGDTGWDRKCSSTR